MPRNQKSARDATGRNAEVLAQQYAVEQEAAASRMALITAAQAQVDLEPVDLTLTHEVPTYTDAGEVSDIQEVEVQEPTKTFRVNETLEDVTFGYGNTFTFEEGRTYTAPVSLYEHLDEKGLVWH